MDNENETPERVTCQTIFDRVARHLLTQNAKAEAPNRSCRYRGQNGTSCAAGCLINDANYNEAFEGLTVGRLCVSDAIAKSLGLEELPRRMIDLLTSLQCIHDAAKVNEWPANLRTLAETEGLSFAVLDEFPEVAAVAEVVS